MQNYSREKRYIMPWDHGVDLVGEIKLNCKGRRGVKQAKSWRQDDEGERTAYAVALGRKLPGDLRKCQRTSVAEGWWWWLHVPLVCFLFLITVIIKNQFYIGMLKEKKCKSHFLDFVFKKKLNFQKSHKNSTLNSFMPFT